MTDPGGCVQQNGVRSDGGPLEGRSHLARLHGIDAIVVGIGGQKDSWIFLTLFHVMVWRVSVEGSELFGISDTPELGDVEGSVGEVFFAKCIVDSDFGLHRAGELRMLDDHRPHKQASVAPPAQRDTIRRPPFRIDQMPHNRGEIVKHCLLACQVAGLMPLRAVFPSSAHIGESVNAAGIEPDTGSGQEVWSATGRYRSLHNPTPTGARYRPVSHPCG